MPLRARLGVIPMLVPAWLEWRRMSASEKEDLNEFFQGLWEPHERIWTPEATYEPVDGGRRWLKSASLKGPLHFLEPLDGEAGGVRLVGSGVIRQAPCREYRIEAARPVSVWLDSEGRVRQIVEHGDSWRRTTELWDFGGPAAIELPAEAIVVTSDDDASDPGARPPSPFDTDTPLG